MKKLVLGFTVLMALLLTSVPAFANHRYYSGCRHTYSNSGYYSGSRHYSSSPYYYRPQVYAYAPPVYGGYNYRPVTRYPSYWHNHYYRGYSYRCHYVNGYHNYQPYYAPPAGFHFGITVVH